jgi:sulfite exporter TauE/SafE/copper chaperone CopZ
MKNYTFHVQGMHCAACVLLTESELETLPSVNRAKANLGKCSVEIEGNFQSDSPEIIAKQLSETLKPHGYTLRVNDSKNFVNWSDFKIAIPIALLVIILFLLLQKLGIVNLVTISTVNYGTAFIIGLIASVSTCMAVVGGLVLSMSAQMAKTGEAKKPQILFHIGRLLSFFFLGGVIGILGATFEPGIWTTLILSLIIGLVMLILGINLLDIFPWAKKLQPTLPVFISKRLLSIKKFNHSFTPLLLGVITFFLPCGFTQSMQIYAISTHSFWTGAFIMSAFALGTLPILGLISFSSLNINPSKASIFFKTMGLITIFFALFNIYNSLVAIELLPSWFSF